MKTKALTLFEQKAVDDLAIEMFDATDHRQFSQRLEVVAQLLDCSVAELMVYVRKSLTVFLETPREPSGAFGWLEFDLPHASAALRRLRAQSTFSRIKAR